MANLADLINRNDLGKVQTMKDNPPFKTERQQIQQELSEADEDSVADADAKAAKRIHRTLEMALLGMDSSVKAVEREMSSFNAPGMRVAFLGAIAKSIKGGGQKFDIKSALKGLEKYYKGR